MSDSIASAPATRGATKRVTNKRDDYAPDDGISARCVTIAARHGHSRRAAEGCQFNSLGHGGTVGCPDCPYNRPKPAGNGLN